MSEFRITLKDRDGNTIIDRKSQRDWFFLTMSNKPDRVYIEYSLKVDCRNKGVRLLRYDVGETGIRGEVDYL